MGWAGICGMFPLKGESNTRNRNYRIDPTKSRGKYKLKKILCI